MVPPKQERKATWYMGAGPDPWAAQMGEEWEAVVTLALQGGLGQTSI